MLTPLEMQALEALRKIDHTLSVEAAEYVPAIRDAFNIIDAAILALESKGEQADASQADSAAKIRAEALEEVALHLEDIDALCAEEVRAMKEQV